MEHSQKQFVEMVFEEMYEELERFLRHYSYDKDLVEDILQETYLAAYNHADELMNNDKYRNWMYATAANKAMKMNKSNRRHYECLSFEEQKDVPVQPEYDVIRFSNLRAIVDATDYDLLMLHFDDKYTYEEIDRLYGTSTSYIKMKVFRILRMLRSNLKDKEL